VSMIKLQICKPGFGISLLNSKMKTQAVSSSVRRE